MKIRLILMLVFGGASLGAQQTQNVVAPRVYVNTPKDWVSMESVLVAGNSLPETDAGYGFEEQWAVLFGLREVDRVLRSLEPSDVHARVESCILRGRSIVEIARLGVLIKLGETSRFASDRIEEQVEKAYSSRELATQVLIDRRDALRALKILSLLKQDGNSEKS